LGEYYDTLDLVIRIVCQNIVITPRPLASLFDGRRGLLTGSMRCFHIVILSKIRGNEKMALLNRGLF
jgi:hypothetical protein